MAISTVIRRNFVSVLFPSLAFSAIYIDWSHTKKWKELKRSQAA